MTICDYILIIFEVCILIMILTSHKYAGDTVVTEEKRRHKDGGGNE